MSAPPPFDPDVVFGLTDDITTCPHCGARTEWEDTGGPHDEQKHTCLRCGFVFLGFFDPEDFDEDGNFVGYSEED